MQAECGKRNIVLAAIIAITIHAWLLFLWTPPKAGSMFRDVKNSFSVSMIYPISTQVFPEPQISPEPIRKSLSQPTAKQTIDKTIIKKVNAASDNFGPEPMAKKTQDAADKSGEATKAVLSRPEAISPMTLPDVPEGYSSAEPVADIVQQEASEIGEDRAVSILEETGNEGSNIFSALKKAEPTKAVITYARPEYKKNPPPRYPGIARRRGYQGRTNLKVEVLKSGRVGRIKMVTSSGFDVLDKAALEAVKGWRFIPGTRNGNRTRQWVVVPIRFRLQ
jgi:protein TonB